MHFWQYNDNFTFIRKKPFYRRKRVFVLILVCFCVSSFWYYYSSDDHPETAQASNAETNTETQLSIMVQEPISLTDSDEPDHKPFEYEVEPGDTLSGIAQRYSLKLTTLLWANDLNEKSIIRPGQTLTLLPVDGVLHKIEKGETISEVAGLHKGDTERIIAYNHLEDPNLIFPGDMIIVPDGQPIPRAPAGAGPSSSLAGSVGKLLWPTSAKNITQGYSVSHRGLDIANGGRPPIYAAHDGTVIFSGTDGAWGRTIVIRASNGLSTRYAHNSENYVKTGQKVKRGQTIAKVGNTGNVRGRTGLHLHFSVYKNGIAINPMSVLR